MKSKLSISSIALMVSSQAFALIGPIDPTNPIPEPHKACIGIYKASDKTQYAGNCDETSNNLKFGKKLLVNGCTKDQAFFSDYEVQLSPCPDPRIVQL